MSNIAQLSAIILLSTPLLFSLPMVRAESPDVDEKTTSVIPAQHHLVIQVNTNDAEQQDHLLTNIANLQKFYGLDNIEIEVVAYGPGIWLVTDKSQHAARVRSFLLQNVVFTACGNTLDAVEKKDGQRPRLIDGVKTTEAGIARIIELQEKGWSYLSP